MFNDVQAAIYVYERYNISSSEPTCNMMSTSKLRTASKPYAIQNMTTFCLDTDTAAATKPLNQGQGTADRPKTAVLSKDEYYEKLLRKLYLSGTLNGNNYRNF